MESSLVHFFKESTQRMPDSVAIIHGDRRASYSQLFSKTCSLAGFLHDSGLKHGDRVAILQDNSIEYIVIYYGVLAAGGVAVGLNTATKSRDIVNWIVHSGASFLFANSRHPELNKILPSLSDHVSVVLLGDEANEAAEDYRYKDWKSVVAHPADNNTLHLSRVGDQLASIIYTSGTTGSPKGVMLSHANLASNTKSILDYLGLVDTDRVMNVLPFYYSYGNSVLHTHLAVGATIILENSLLYPHKVLERMVSNRATGFSGVPSTFSLLLSRTSLDDYDLSSLRYITQAGGAMAPSSIEKLRKYLPRADFFVMYGQTEATARLSYLPPDVLDKQLGSIGIAIPGVTLEIRDKQGNKTEPGQVGEICARGKNIMLGYWKNLEATQKVIRAGWLLTGDLAYYNDSGYIFISGRASEMIKSGANRISPKEVEEVIAECDGIEEVAVVGVPDEILGQVIKAVIVAIPDTRLESKKILAYCRQNLAMYKVPKFIDFVQNLPKTSSGKVKRYLLNQL